MVLSCINAKTNFSKQIRFQNIPLNPPPQPPQKSFVNLAFFHVITLFIEHKINIEK